MPLRREKPNYKSKKVTTGMKRVVFHVLFVIVNVNTYFPITFKWRGDAFYYCSRFLLTLTFQIEWVFLTIFSFLFFFNLLIA